ncbi:MAG: DUF523 domain-containing protein [Planctomycetes bacterium]|nr:DUF523 domain-containing protein [Planctomycetota bacterium]
MQGTLEEFLKRAGDSPILVSTCLVGLRTRYDGDTRPDDQVVALMRTRRLIPVCPEQLGGLATPRVKSSLSGGDGEAVLEGLAKVVNEAGRNVTEQFLRGARETVNLARMTGARFAILKEKSPSCGVAITNIDFEPAPGCGVTTAALRMLGIEVFAVL